MRRRNGKTFILINRTHKKEKNETINGFPQKMEKSPLKHSAYELLKSFEQY